MGLLVSSYALQDYERYEKSRSVELRCLDGLICPEDGLKRLLHGGRDATRGALSCTRREVSLRASQKHLANNSAVLTKTQLLDKVSKHLPVTNGALETDRAFGVTPMRALPAKYNLALIL